MDKTLSIGEVAEKLGVSTETLRRWDKSGKFPSQRHPINNYRYYTTEQVESLVQEISPAYGLVTLFAAISTPYFQTGLGKLYKSDAVDFLRSIDSESVDMIFADPPYNIKKAEWDTFQSQQAYVEWSIEWIREAQRVLAPTGSLYICGFSEILADLKWAASPLFKGCKWLVWHYRNKANLGKDWGRSHESILHFRKSTHFKFNIDDVRVPYNAHTLKYPTHPQAESSQYNNSKKKDKKYVWTPHPKGAKPKDVFEIPTLSNHSWERVDHPTQKPVELVRKFVEASSDKGDLVIDPFGGSGTTYAVAEALGRRWMGSELNAEYCERIRNRLMGKENLLRIAQGDDEEKAVKRRQKLRGQ